MKQDNNEENTNRNVLNNAINFKDSNTFFDSRIAVPEYISTRFAAQYLGVSENALRIRVCRGEIQAYKFGRQLRFRTDEIVNLFTKIR